MHTRRIPSTGEALPVVGCGTWLGFDIGGRPAERPSRRAVLDALFAAGGRVIDSSPMYGSAEDVVGSLLAEAGDAGKAFLATKVWTSGRAEGIAQMEQSFARLRASTVDLMQVHNLVDWRTHLPTLRAWKERGRLRYLGITHYAVGSHADLEAAMRAERWDFVQLNYSVAEPQAAARLLPLASELGMAVLVNLPFGGGKVVRRLRGRPLPAWARELGCTEWTQVLLKFVLSQPAVTCAIPGTSSPQHMAANAAAGAGEIPPPAFWTPARLDELA